MIQIAAARPLSMSMMFPLQGFVDVARFFWAAAAFPAGLPDRARRVLARVPVAIMEGEQLLQNLLNRLLDSPPAQQLVDELPPKAGMVLLPPVEICVACEAPLQIAHPTHPSHPCVLTHSHGLVPDVQFFAKKCTKKGCGALHYMSYAIGVGDTGQIPKGKQRVYNTAGRWWQVTPCTAFGRPSFWTSMNNRYCTRTRVQRPSARSILPCTKCGSQ